MMLQSDTNYARAALCVQMRGSVASCIAAAYFKISGRNTFSDTSNVPVSAMDASYAVLQP
jgi:hypothetical protein